MPWRNYICNVKQYQVTQKLCREKNTGRNHVKILTVDFGGGRANVFYYFSSFLCFILVLKQLKFALNIC